MSLSELRSGYRSGSGPGGGGGVRIRFCPLELWVVGALTFGEVMGGKGWGGPAAFASRPSSPWSPAPRSSPPRSSAPWSPSATTVHTRIGQTSHVGCTSALHAYEPSICAAVTLGVYCDFTVCMLVQSGRCLEAAALRGGDALGPARFSVGNRLGLGGVLEQCRLRRKVGRG